MVPDFADLDLGTEVSGHLRSRIPFVKREGRDTKSQQATYSMSFKEGRYQDFQTLKSHLILLNMKSVKSL